MDEIFSRWLRAIREDLQCFNNVRIYNVTKNHEILSSCRDYLHYVLLVLFKMEMTLVTALRCRDELFLASIFACCIVLCCIILYYIVLCCIVLCCILLCCILLYCIFLCRIVLCCIVLYCMVLWCTVLCRDEPFVFFIFHRYFLLCSAVSYEPILSWTIGLISNDLLHYRCNLRSWKHIWNVWLQ